MRAAWLAWVAPWVLLCAGCSGPSPRDLPRDEPYLLVIKSARLPSYTGALVSRAHHTWFDLKRGDELDWERLEVLSKAPVSEERVLRRLRISPALARARG